jgi:hypothetical protein
MFIHALSVVLPICLIMLTFSMTMNIGRVLLPNNVVPGTRVSADGAPRYKPGGATIDWTTVTAVGSDTALPEANGAIIKAGQKYLRFGQVMTRITANGKFGPYDPAAADGRQTLTRGDCFVLDETITEYSGGISALTPQLTEYGSFIDGGRIYIDKVIQSGVAAHTLALGPTRVEFDAAFPAFLYAKD